MSAPVVKKGRKKGSRVDEKDIDAVIPPGKWTLSFKLVLKNKHGYSTHLVSKTIVAEKNMARKTVLQEMADDFVKEQYHHSNVDVDAIIKVEVRSTDDVDLMSVKLKGAQPLQYKMFPDDVFINRNHNECVLDYMMSQIHPVWPKYTRKHLIEYFGPACLTEGISSRQILNWCCEEKKKVSCYVLDPFLKCIDSVHASGTSVELLLVFIVNNDHLYPIVNPEMKRYVAKCKALTLGEIKFDVLDYSSSCFVSLLSDSKVSWICGDIQWHKDEVSRYVVSKISEHTEKVLFIDLDDLSFLMKAVIETTEHLVINTHFRHSVVTAFQHPVTGQVWMCASEYKEREYVCGAMREQFKGYIGFQFTNQSWLQLAKEHFTLSVGELHESWYGPDYLQVLNDYPVAPYIVQMGVQLERGQDSDIRSFDGRLCYTGIIENNTCDYNVFGTFDEVRPFTGQAIEDAGEYYVDKDIYMGGVTIKIPSGWFPRVFVQYAVAKGYICLADVTHVIKASSSLPANLFKEWSEKVRKQWPGYSKSLINHFIGQLNKQFKHTNQGAVTDSWDVAVGTLTMGADVRVMPFGSNLFFMRKTTKQRVLKGSAPIWRHIICSSWMYLDRLHREVVGPDTKVLCYNTDCIKVLNPKWVKVVDKEFAKPGDITRESNRVIKGTYMDEIKPNLPFLSVERTWRDVDTYSDAVRGSYLVTGMPGSGKTYQLIKRVKAMERNDVKHVVLGFTNKAVDNIRKEGVKNVYTLDKYFPQDEGYPKWIEKGSRLDCIVLEEFSMVPKKWFNLLWALKHKNPKLTFHLYGDMDQTHAIENDDVWHDYGTAGVVKVLCDGQKHEFAYLGHRYDQAMYAELIHFKQTGRLREAIWKDKQLFSPTECDFNVTQSRTKTGTVNTQWLRHNSQGKLIHLVGYMTMYDGMPVISFNNYPKLRVYNSNRLTVQHVDARANVVRLLVDGAEPDEACDVPTSEFARMKGDKPVHFGYGWSETLIRVQGETLRCKYNIHEVSRMSWNELYTALSRGTCIANVGMLYTDKVFERHQPTYTCKALTMKPAKLSVGFIYKMEDDAGFCYIGSTDRPLEQREHEHRTKPTSKKMEDWLAAGGVRMSLVESLMFREKAQLLKAERICIAGIPPARCMNTKHAQQAALAETVDKPVAVIVQDAQFDRFAITDDEKGKRFRIRWSFKGKKSDKAFSYKVKAKAVALAEAEAFRSELLRMNFV